MTSSSEQGNKLQVSVKVENLSA